MTARHIPHVVVTRQPHPRPLRRRTATLPLPVDRLPRFRQELPSCGAACRRSTGNWQNRFCRFVEVTRREPLGEGAGRRGNARLGILPWWRCTATISTRPWWRPPSGVLCKSQADVSRVRSRSGGDARHHGCKIAWPPGATNRSAHAPCRPAWSVSAATCARRGSPSDSASRPTRHAPRSWQLHDRERFRIALRAATAKNRDEQKSSMPATRSTGNTSPLPMWPDPDPCPERRAAASAAAQPHAVVQYQGDWNAATDREISAGRVQSAAGAGEHRFRTVDRQRVGTDVAPAARHRPPTRPLPVAPLPPAQRGIRIDLRRTLRARVALWGVA